MTEQIQVIVLTQQEENFRDFLAGAWPDARLLSLDAIPPSAHGVPLSLAVVEASMWCFFAMGESWGLRQRAPHLPPRAL